MFANRRGRLEAAPSSWVLNNNSAGSALVDTLGGERHNDDQ